MENQQLDKSFYPTEIRTNNGRESVWRWNIGLISAGNPSLKPEKFLTVKTNLPHTIGRESTSSVDNFWVDEVRVDNSLRNFW